MKYFELQREVLKDWMAVKVKGAAPTWKKGEDDVIQGFTALTDNKAIYFIEKEMFLLDYQKMEMRMISNGIIQPFVKSAERAEALVSDCIKIDTEGRKVAVYKHSDGSEKVIDTKYLKYIDSPDVTSVPGDKKCPFVFVYEFETLRAVIMPILK